MFGEKMNTLMTKLSLYWFVHHFNWSSETFVTILKMTDHTKESAFTGYVLRVFPNRSSYKGNYSLDVLGPGKEQEAQSSH